MIFYVRRTLPSGLIRFGAGQRAPAVETPKRDETFSTDGDGAYLRRSGGGLYFAEERGASTAPVMSSEQKIREQSALTFRQKVIIGAGIVIFFWGLLLFMRKGDPIAWILILGGLAMVGTPIVKTMKLRRELREKAARERAAREEEERKRRELVGEFSSVLENYRRDHSRTAAEGVRRAREGRPIPYDAVAPLARDTVLHIAFRQLDRFGSHGAEGFAREIDAAADAVGLSDEDRRLVKRQIYQKIVWHLLADDRMSDGHAPLLAELRRVLQLVDDEVALEEDAIRQFNFLRGMRVGNLPSVDAPVALKFQEVCHHRSRGEMRKASRRHGWRNVGARYLSVTSKRAVISNGKETPIRYEDIRNLEVDVDQNLLTIVDAENESHTLVLPDPIYTAGMIVIASETPLKPKGLV